MFKKTSGLMTTGGILAAFGTSLIGIPQIVLQTYAIVVKDGPPHWFTLLILPMLLAGFVMIALGTAIMGVAGKGADEHSIPAQSVAAQAKVDAQTPEQLEQANELANLADIEAKRKP